MVGMEFPDILQKQDIGKMEMSDEPAQTRLFTLHGVLDVEGGNSKTLGGDRLPMVRG